MAVYTLTTNLIENITPSDDGLFSSLFAPFINETAKKYKIAIDNKKVIYTLYANALKKVNKEVKVHYASWLKSFSKILMLCEEVDVDITGIDDKDIAFLEVASKIKGCKKKIIIYSTQKYSYPVKYVGDYIIEYNGEEILVLDKDKANNEINSNTSNMEINETVYINNGNNNCNNNSGNNNCNNNNTSGDNSPIGDNNKVKGKKSIKYKLAIGGIITGIVASLVANYIWDIF